MKRAFDIAAAAAGLFLLSPLLFVLVALIRSDSPGPAIFAQPRVGRDRRVFICRKLRTMREGTAHVPTHEAPQAQITRIGRTLRAAKLDELPQLWNVLTGEMSFVGPRPCLPTQTLLIEERDRRGVYALRPGITGLAQVEGIDMSDPVRLAARDADYLATRSFAGDIAILLRTFVGEGGGDRTSG